jgi:transposase-like protein
VAHGPNQVWSWDITALKGPVKGTWYKCYVILDIYSRYVTGWLVAAAEDATVAKDFLDEAITRNGSTPHTIHADRGGAMVSKPVSELLVNLGVLRSHSRPRTSNDNPYSEAQFKTLKYMPDFPDRFGSIEDARTFCDHFFVAYNHEHATPGSGCTHPPPCTSAPPSNPSPAADHAQSGLRRTPRTLHTPPSTAPTARASLDQPARRPAATNPVNTTCLI